MGANQTSASSRLDENQLLQSKLQMPEAPQMQRLLFDLQCQTHQRHIKAGKTGGEKMLSMFPAYGRGSDDAVNVEDRLTERQKRFHLQ